jgi:hypothetical protein
MHTDLLVSLGDCFSLCAFFLGGFLVYSFLVGSVIAEVMAS